jgi:hypothetical protein
MYVRLVEDSLQEYAYDAAMASLTYSVQVSDVTALTVVFRGYNHKLGELMKVVLQRMKNFKVVPERFAIIKVAPPPPPRQPLSHHPPCVFHIQLTTHRDFRCRNR